MFPFGWKRLSGWFQRLWRSGKRTENTEDHPEPVPGKLSVSLPKLDDGEATGSIETLDENLKKRIKHLGDAINQSLSESEPIANAIADIKAAGYDIFLVLEATIGFSQQGEEGGKPAMVAASMNAREPEFRVTAQDMKFLKSLRIRLDE